MLKKGDELFDQAENLTGDDATAKEYVAKNRLCLRYVKIAKDPAAASDVSGFIADCRKFGIGQVSEGTSLDQWEKAHKK